MVAAPDPKLCASIGPKSENTFPPAAAFLTLFPGGLYPRNCSLERMRLRAGFRGLGKAKFGGAGFPMFIEIKALLLHPVDFEQEFAPGAIDFGPDIQQREPLRSAGRAQLIEEHHGK